MLLASTYRSVRCCFPDCCKTFCFPAPQAGNQRATPPSNGTAFRFFWHTKWWSYYCFVDFCHVFGYFTVQIMWWSCLAFGYFIVQILLLLFCHVFFSLPWSIWSVYLFYNCFWILYFPVFITDVFMDLGSPKICFACLLIYAESVIYSW
jgi:hypothetical protein